MDALHAAVAVPNAVAASLIGVAVLVTTGGPTQRKVGILVALLALAPAWLLPEEHSLVRAISAQAMFILAMRVVDLRDGRWTLASRALHVGSAIDTRRLTRITPGSRRLDAASMGIGLAWLAVAALGYAMLRETASASSGALRLAERWGSTLLVVYGGVAAGYALARAAYAAAGYETGPLHEAPILARTVGEFWGERWARPVSTWLRETVFRPWAKRRHAVIGGLLAFALSAGFHAYLVWVGLGLVRGLTMAGCMLAYFLLQALVAGLERALGVRKWSPPAGHAWTAAWMLAAAPLFLEPVARVLGF